MVQVLTHLVNAYSESEKKQIDYQWLKGDTRLTIVGGSDTTAATLTFMFYHLTNNPSLVQKLRYELEPLLNGRNVLEQNDISKAQYLDGIILEALRMHPAIPSGFPRLTPPEGITVGDTFIPGGTTVVLPVYAMQRDEANYEYPDEFIPERWYSRPELIRRREAFLSWNVGKHKVDPPCTTWKVAPDIMGAGTNGCIGRALAITEMRDLLTHWIQNFQAVRFAPGEDGSRLVHKTTDNFTVGVKPLHLIFDEKERGDALA